MDEAALLDTLANTLNDLSATPYDVSLHAQHIRIARSLPEMEAQVLSAHEMAANSLAVGEHIWIYILDEKAGQIDLDTPSGVMEMLALYEQAENDFLSISILQKHVEFILDRFAHFGAIEQKPAELGELCSIEWTRANLNVVVAKGLGHLSKSYVLWDKLKDWELEMLEATPPDERDAAVMLLDSLFLARLQQPHAKHEDTYSAYSSFTTTYQVPEAYESFMVAASQLRAKAVKAYERRDRYETASLSADPLPAYLSYVTYERRAKVPDPFVAKGVYERALAELAKRHMSLSEVTQSSSSKMETEEALRALWNGYADYMRTSAFDEVEEMQVLRRAIRSVPGSGEVWARYIRFLERKLDQDEEIEEVEKVTDAYDRAFATGLFSKDPAQIIPLVLSRAGFEKRQLEAQKSDGDSLLKVVEDGIALVRKATPEGDPLFRLEKFLSHLFISLELPDNAIALWQATAKHYKSSYLAWTTYTDILIKYDRHDVVRSAFQDVSTKNIDWPEVIWEAWLSFEHSFGSLDEIENAIERVDKARTIVNARRAKEAEQAAAQYAARYPAARPEAEQAMDVDTPAQVEEPVVAASTNSGTKRKVEDASEQPVGESSKKARVEAKPAPLKRDRENCAVFISSLPLGTDESDLNALFKDCGEIRGIKITELPQALVATVEFGTRDSVPAALTKDKKRIRGEEIAVHLAWRSTLYVTNFPESYDDARIREMFGQVSQCPMNEIRCLMAFCLQYGTIFDVRWPSKKYKSTRRFCYVQYTAPAAAENALVLHNFEVEPSRKLSVLISNPERKKERTDADANEKEVYVAGLSKYTTKEDLKGVFKTYGTVNDVRLVTDKNGQSKGFAFVEFESETSAQAALSANNYELRSRRIAVTLADSRVKPRYQDSKDTGLGRQAELQQRSVRIRNLPAGAQEGLLQQALEKYCVIKRVEVFEDRHEAVAELESQAEAGKLILRTGQIVFNGNALDLTEEGKPGAGGGPSSSTRTAAPAGGGGLFVPRSAASRPRAGLGRARIPGVVARPGTKSTVSAISNQSSVAQGEKGQDDFRKMLG
ncbi:hypothetical protein CONPUDRAFT_103939 [Coniophora puteana RWD-64-598 SS2]|uniref:RRM domain-containing protein n=1 Tax=Coniophora puteana (strain RWD-64-598) TaxID=741705 RepID=A0A5M3MP17_CONPW|nr:uncharacterized protein CONPUDRAFT_103939 [Coniophora puteana RWD-64-598 SS2]EIW80918.1 hypothetical protein CONPUDRAFT_103939 [Coniophora puteana RWD-64-598 SS2]